MAFRSRTPLFQQFRSAAVARRAQFPRAWEDDSDKKKLIQTQDPESQKLIPHSNKDSLPPVWIDTVEEVQADVARIKTRIRELSQLHEKHVKRPNLDDNADEEHTIEIMTQQITNMIKENEKKVKALTTDDGASQSQLKMCKNIKSALALEIQDISGNFRKIQASYLKGLRAREDRSKQFSFGDKSDYTFLDDDVIDEYVEKGFTDEQMQQLHENEMAVSQREHEILQIAKSINELAEIFKQLSELIIDQGTVLDRIDFNIEQTLESVTKGTEEVAKSEKLQGKTTKKLMIIILFLCVILMIFLLIFAKKHG
eukprot:Colp12_sorted_trinity150504_noHs@15059